MGRFGEADIGGCGGADIGRCGGADTGTAGCGGAPGARKTGIPLRIGPVPDVGAPSGRIPVTPSAGGCGASGEPSGDVGGGAYTTGPGVRAGS